MTNYVYPKKEKSCALSLNFKMYLFISVSHLCLRSDDLHVQLMQGGTRVYICHRDTSPPGSFEFFLAFIL